MPRTTSTGWPAGSWELPVLVALARIDRTGIPAAHGDDHISGADRLVGKGLGEGPGQVDAHLGLAHAEGGCSTVLEGLRRDGRALANTPAIHSIMRHRQQLDAEIKSHKQLMASLTKQFVVIVSYDRPATSVA
jgi:hypothetical protein